MKVLFVCSGNAYRSPVAEALLKKLKPGITVDSAGTNPAIPISQDAKEYVARENALKHLKRTPEGLEEKDLDSYDLIVTMEQNHKVTILKICPHCKSKLVVWNIDDPYFLPSGLSERVFEQIREKVQDLADSLI